MRLKLVQGRNNYRPISLFPSLSKILEKLIKICLLKFFDKHQVLYENQYGFREKYSTLHALLDVTSETNNAIQRNHYTVLMFIDLRKAFDSVFHKILLQKLYHYGIRGPAHKLIESYLTSRYQFVSHNSTTSSSKAINIGVPQESILGPLLFLIYINDLSNAIISKPRLFADDTCLILNNPRASALETACNLKLHNLYKWCNANKLQINPPKSAVLTIPSKLNSPKLDLNINYNASPISCHESCYYLGVYIDSKMQFKTNIKLIEVKIAKAVGILNKLRFFFPKTTLLLLYCALVHPHLLYALPVWGCTFSSYLIKLQCLQNKAIRIIFNSNRLTSVTTNFHALEILKIEDLFKYEVDKLMFQFSKKNSSPLLFLSFYLHFCYT